MNPKKVRKYALHYKRLRGLPCSRKFRYMTSVLLGEAYRRRGFGPFGRRLVEITLTDRCQCRCVHCYNEIGEPISETDELSTEKVASILEEASAFGFLEANFTGGEPLMRRDIVDLVRYARKSGIVPKMNTNGILLTESMVSELGAAGLAWGSVSIDSADPEKHDSLRQYSGCFDLAVQGIRRLIGEEYLQASQPIRGRRASTTAM